MFLFSSCRPRCAAYWTAVDTCFASGLFVPSMGRTDSADVRTAAINIVHLAPLPRSKMLVCRLRQNRWFGLVYPYAPALTIPPPSNDIFGLHFRLNESMNGSHYRRRAVCWKIWPRARRDRSFVGFTSHDITASSAPSIACGRRCKRSSCSNAYADDSHSVQV